MRRIKKFDVIKAISDEQKFSEMIFDLIRDYKSPDELAKLLSEKFPEDGLQKLKSIAQSSYPLSLDGRQ